MPEAEAHAGSTTTGQRTVIPHLPVFSETDHQDQEGHSASRPIASMFAATKKVMKHLLLSGDQQLASGLALVSVVIDIERIGDYTKNIFDLARRHPNRLLAGSIEGKLQEIEADTKSVFRKTIQAFREGDEELAREAMEDYMEDISTDCEKLVDDLIAGNVEGLEGPEYAAVVLYLRYLKRIGSHSRNIASSIVNPFHRIGYREKKEDGHETDIVPPLE